MSRIFKNRDSATTILRKLGVDKKEYHRFVVQDGSVYILDLEAAQRFVAKPVSAEVAKIKKTAARKEAAGDKAPRKSMSGFIEQLIKDGLDNAAIHAEVTQNFPGYDAAGKQKHYPSWYRCRLNRVEGRMKY